MKASKKFLAQSYGSVIAWMQEISKEDKQMATN